MESFVLTQGVILLFWLVAARLFLGVVSRQLRWFWGLPGVMALVLLAAFAYRTLVATLV
jgi:hypothetical protein